MIFKLALLNFPHQILVGGFCVWSVGHDVGPALKFGTRPVWRAGEATERSSLGTTQRGSGGSNRGGHLSRIIFWMVRIFESWKGKELQGCHFFRDDEKRESPFDFWLTPGTSCCMAACVGHAENASGTTSHTASSWGRQEGWKTWKV